MLTVSSIIFLDVSNIYTEILYPILNDIKWYLAPQEIEMLYSIVCTFFMLYAQSINEFIKNVFTSHFTFAHKHNF